MSSSFPSVVSLIFSSGIAAKTVLAILLVLSVTSWGVIFYKSFVFRKAQKENRRFLAHFSKSLTLQTVRSATLNPNEGPFWCLAKNLIEPIDPYMDWEQGTLFNTAESPVFSGIERTLQSRGQEEVAYYEEGVPFLATIGNTAPFIGLLGTVWSIMNTFRSIGLQESANMATVAPGIAEALVATAAGLATAIPAAIAYNFFVSRIRTLENQLGIFTSELITLVEAAYRPAFPPHEISPK